MKLHPFDLGPPDAWVAANGLPVGGALFDAGGERAEARYAALLLQPVEVLEWREGESGDPFQSLAAMQARLPEAAELPCPLVACALSYDLGRVVERLPSLARADGALPDLWAARYAAGYLWDRDERRGWLYGEAAAFAGLEARLRAPPSTPPPPQVGPPVAEMSEDEYVGAVHRILAHIRAGDVYQVNYTLRFSAPLEAPDPSALFARLHARSPVPFAALLRVAEDQTVLSMSPERFLRWRGRAVETRPIKGTRPRAEGAGDAEQIAALKGSAKDAAEHVMIVDLERNDLGRVCEPGSVRVSRAAQVETYSTVHHLVSTVEGRLREEVGLAELLRATFPGGSITGAPKVRAMQIIESLEPTRRGIYCGAVGYLERDGGDLNIPIRTAWTAGGRLYYQAGGGIVADSDPQAEWAEAWLKAKAFLEAV